MSAKLLDLEVVHLDGEAWFQFSWSGESWEWREALDALKATVPYGARQFDPESKVWRVRTDYEDALDGIFPNFAGALDAMRSQLSMF